MKKRISENGKSFWFFRPAWLLVLLGVASCSIQNQISKDDFGNIPKNFSGIFYDQPDTLQYGYDQKIYTKSLVKDFAQMNNINYSKPVRITIKDTEMFLGFEDAHKKQHVLKFYGKRHHKKFVFYTNYETVSFPIIFIKKEMTKFSVYLPNNSEILFENHRVNEGMFLLFGAGNDSKSNYKFKLLNNE